ncbi:MAG: hypothetical protein HYZ20_13280 [Burkholderiales bacterium]|nr:hypothetical protein [Burkholderiales bacterium]
MLESKTPSTTVATRGDVPVRSPGLAMNPPHRSRDEERRARSEGTAVSPRARLLCGVGALATTGTLVAALLGLFHQASPTRWFEPTEELLALSESCQALAGRAERFACTQTVVAAYRDRVTRGVMLADGR